MASRWETLQVGGSPMRVYISTPDGSGPHPGMLVGMHIGGVDGHIQTMCDRLAEAGYEVASPDLYHRQDDNILEEAAKLPPPERMPLLATKKNMLRDNEIEADLRASLDLLRGSGVGSAPVGITGFCMGGRIAYLGAVSIQGIAAVAPFYGGDTMALWAGEGPTPFDRSADLTAPMIFFFGDDDQNPSPADREKLDAELTRLGKEHHFHHYEGTGHAFMMEGAPPYREHAAKDSWAKLLEFLGEQLKVPA
jgi:carboxymethylenebutenolidase